MISTILFATHSVFHKSILNFYRIQMLGRLQIIWLADGDRSQSELSHFTHLVIDAEGREQRIAKSILVIAT